MGLSGFDPNLVNQSINSVQRAYENLIQALGDDMQTKFIGGMQDKWACNDAQQFFNNNFKPSIDSLLSESTRIFESVVNTMGQAGEAWAEQTKSSYSAPGFSSWPDGSRHWPGRQTSAGPVPWGACPAAPPQRLRSIRQRFRYGGTWPPETARCPAG